MRIAIVNDLRLAVEALRRVVESVPDAEVAWVALDGQQALDACRRDRPDLVLMDLIMPVMDGVESTRRIMAECPCPIVVVTATVDGNAAKVYDALGHGALDAVNTPVLGLQGRLEGAEPLVRKIDLVRRMFAPRVGGRGGGRGAAPARGAAAAGPAPPPVPCAPAPGQRRVLAIGASTGGPQALATLLSGLPSGFDLPIVIVQHVDAEFVPGFVRWLGELTGRRVVCAEPGELASGSVHVASRNLHLVVTPAGRLEYREAPEGLLHRPSVDVLFASLAEAPSLCGCAVLLTGMGRDGAEGLLQLRQRGWCTIAQDRATSVVWGMPGSAVQIDAAVAVLPISEIAARVARESAAAAAKGHGARST